MASRLKDSFPRNYNIEKKYRPTYNKLKGNNELFKDKGHKDIFIMAMILGFNAKISEKISESYPVINCNAFSDQEVWLIATIAIADKGLGVLNDMLEMRKIAEGYANGGFKILEKKLYSDKPGTILKHFESEIMEAIK